MATLVGNGMLRSAVMGYDNRPLTDNELKAMCWQVAQATEQGAFGLSSGLTLYPSSVAHPKELVALCEEMALWGGLRLPHAPPGWLALPVGGGGDLQDGAPVIQSPLFGGLDF